jgi:NitT/TauT family transport system substrate-binding protein
MRKHTWLRQIVVLGAALTLLATACGDDDDDAAADGDTTTVAAGDTVTTVAGDTGGGCASVDSVKLQLQWVTQAQFAGYFAAVDQGLYEKNCLNVEILEGGVEIVPQTQLATGAADFAIAWVPKALASREQGAGITDVAQIFQRSGTLQVSFRDALISEPADLEGKNVGNWGFGNEFELFAGITQAGLDPATDVNLVGQQFDMQALLKGEIDAAQAMIYNEYAQVLEAENPATGELYTADDLSVIDWNEVGTAMLQDAIWANTERLNSDPAYQDITVRFIKASIEGWVYCRENAESCRDIVVARGSTLGLSHQLWQMNEINKLIWPSPAGAGVIDQALWDQTVTVALSAKNLEGTTVITQAPDAEAFTNTYVEQALAQLKAEGLDVTGEGFAPITVTLNPGGE